MNPTPKPAWEESKEEFIRDCTSVVPLSKSEVRSRLHILLASQRDELRKKIEALEEIYLIHGAGTDIKQVFDDIYASLNSQDKPDKPEEPESCFHQCTSNCRRVGCNCECGEWHELKDI